MVKIFTVGWSHYLYFILRIVVGIIFIWASYNKVLDPSGFAIIIQNYKILPAWLINPAAIILPWIEILCGLFLVTGFFVKGSLLIVNLLMLIFAAAITINIYRGIDINCGCFTLTPVVAKSMYYYLLRDLCFLCTGVGIFFFKIKMCPKESYKIFTFRKDCKI